MYRPDRLSRHCASRCSLPCMHACPPSSSSVLAKPTTTVNLTSECWVQPNYPPAIPPLPPFMRGVRAWRGRPGAVRDRCRPLLFLAVHPDQQLQKKRRPYAVNTIGSIRFGGIFGMISSAIRARTDQPCAKAYVSVGALPTPRAADSSRYLFLGFFCYAHRNATCMCCAFFAFSPVRRPPTRQIPTRNR